jgi:hypothetical protein
VTAKPIGRSRKPEATCHGVVRRTKPEAGSREPEGIPSNRDGESHRILLEDSECEIVLRHEDVDRRSQEILDRYRIPADRSPDLMAMKSSPSIDSPADVPAEVTPAEPPATPTSAASQ